MRDRPRTLVQVKPIWTAATRAANAGQGIHAGRMRAPTTTERSRHAGQRRRREMSEPGAPEPAPGGASLERSREEVLAAARPVPPHEDTMIEDLTDEEERIFVEAILDA